ncbi:phenylalanine--tRNA ligase subunit beta [Sneathiella sp. P13V-1]|uniref:phenylalanine--tRNA ligase subunit beta n=1 Tax=Sneathiella sp. P13V-1 TaxID=2697366 RepID=UPI00187B4D9A|nr:phenylalanine--tRNA ligase subunit beta [Sneathiella sp. P13V-1]MBE7635477.1 phenylalanine--tRNA ligase subunit beta [Sneathiella sp. P13V-1]
MKFSVSWLREHLEFDATLDELSEKLTAIGLEVEEITDRAKELEAFRVCHVIKAEQHPDADKLRVCQVDTGSETVQVVCGAPNARTGMKGVFAPSGSYVPGTDLWLKPTKIRGVESNGMLVSEREMGISDEHNGIIEMPEDTEVGVQFAVLAGLDDPIIEIAITPNHQDALGVYGIARDLAAGGFGTLKELDVSAVAGSYDSPIGVELKFDADADPLPCSKFLGRYVRGVKNGPSPKWMQDRLLSIGLRPISALVDITNFVTFDLGRPLHVFDADKLSGNIQPRLAKAGEKLLALDGEEYTLSDTDCVIADDAAPQGIGGIMGGELSGCTEETTNLFIEAALFDPIAVATTGRRLGIESDARYRFERGVDPDFVGTGMEIATRLVMELCGGEPSHVVSDGEGPEWQKQVSLRKTRVKELGGMDVSVADMISILDRLGFAPKEEGDVIVTDVPSWRMDIDGEADLVEEVMRMVGYDNIPTVALDRENVVAKPSVTPKQRRVRTAKRTLAGRGMIEAVTYSFLPRAHAELFGGANEDLVLANPISTDLDTMRPSLLPNLVAAAGRNQARGFNDICLFEVAGEYHDDTPSGQSTVAAGIRAGVTQGRHWVGAGREYDLFDVKADVLALLEAIGGPASPQIDTGAPEWYHPGRSGVLQLGPKNRLAAFGELHPAVLEAMKVKGRVMAFELYLDNVPMPKGERKTAKDPLQVSDFQAVERDFAFVMDRDVTADKVLRAAKGADKKLIADATVFDIYEGEKVGEGQKSIALSVRLEPQDKTLTDEEIEAVAQKVIANVEKTSGGTLRG